MNVLIIGYPGKKTSGVRTHVGALKDGLLKHNISVEVFNHKFNWIHQKIFAIITKVLFFINKGLSQDLKYKYVRFMFRKQLAAKIKITDVINVQSVIWYDLIKSYSTKYNKRIVLTVHGPLSDELIQKKFYSKYISKVKKAEELAYTEVEYIITVGEKMKEYINSCTGDDKNVSVISNGIVINLQNNLNSEKNSGNINKTIVKCCFLGRLVEQKGVQIAIKAISIVVKSGHPISLDIIGEGIYFNQLKMLVNNNNLNKYISFLGALDNSEARKKLSEYDICLIPSVKFGKTGEEPFNIVCLESMSTGCLTIASNIGGLGKIISDRYDGLLFEPENSEQMAKLIIEFIQNQPKFDIIRSNAIMTVSRDYSSTSMASKFIDVYKQSLE